MSKEPVPLHPLMSACYTHRPELVEYLLQRGANPNHVYDKHETPLSWADFDQFYHERIEPDEVAAGDLKRIIELLRQYEGKYTDELFTDKVSRWLTIFACYPTGLLTLWGNIDIASINGASAEMIDEFNRWRVSHWDTWPDKSWKDMPGDFDRHDHNQWGRKLAERICEILPGGIKVQYLSINAESEAKGIRNVDREDIAKPAHATGQGPI